MLRKDKDVKLSLDIKAKQIIDCHRTQDFHKQSGKQSITNIIYKISMDYTNQCTETLVRRTKRRNCKLKKDLF